MKVFYEILMNGEGLTIKHFKTYERQMPETRKRLHLAICEILESGATISQVARLLEVDRGKIYKMRDGEDIDFLPQRWAIEEDRIIRELYRKKTCKEIAFALKRTERGVNYRMKLMGLRKYKTR